MRWKLIYLVLATAAGSNSQSLTIDNDFNLDNVITAPLPNFSSTTPNNSVAEPSDNEINEFQVPEKSSDEIIDTSSSTESEGIDTDTAEVPPNSKESETISSEHESNDGDESGGNDNENGVELHPNTEEVTKEVDNESDVDQEVPPNSIENKPNSNEATPDSNEKEPNSNEGGEQSAENGETDDPEEVSTSKSLERTEEIIQTKYGQVRGVYLHESTGIRSYIDIPYGAFTELFQAPTEPLPWEDIHEVNDHNKRCPQLQDGETFVGELDCLTLSVFAPSDVENAAVLFHIHDGHFTTGSADPSIYGPEHLVTKGIILVLPNYRLGPLGFLCLQNDVAPGNAALKDLTLALDWTKHNIGAFGGDPAKIVVSGDGTSGALAGYLGISAYSRDYISGVITESGAVIAPWALDRDPVATAHRLEEIIEADIAPNTDIELLIKSAKDIVFKPCVENGPEPFMNETPWEMLHDQETIDINFMIGSANRAGMHEAMDDITTRLKDLNTDFSKFLPNDLRFKNDGQKNGVVDEIKEQYFDDEDISLANADSLSLLFTDSLYLGPAIRTARSLIAAGATVYFFEFSYVGELNRELNSLLRAVNGTCRGDIVGYVFTQDGELPKTEADEAMVDMMSELWVTFTQTGKPSVEWRELTVVEEPEEQWLLIGSEVQQEKGIHVDRLALWTEIYKNHFVDHNLAFAPTSSFCLLFLATIYKLLLN